MSLRIGVIGAGVWGQNLVRNLADIGVLAGVADLSEENRAQVKVKFPETTVYDDHRDLVASGIDAVVIATPAPTHFAIASELIEAGVDVFVEKPMTLGRTDAIKLCDLAEARGRILMVGHLLLYQPAVRWIEDYLSRGELGILRTLHQRRSKLGRARSFENVLWSFGVHDIAVLLQLAGEAPESIVVSGHASLTTEVEDDVYLHLGFASGLKAHLHNSWLWPRDEREFIAVGDRGMLEYNERTHQVFLHRKGIDGTFKNVDDGAEIVFEGSAQPLRLELEHFTECCRTRQKPRSDGRQAVGVIDVLERAEAILRGVDRND